MPGRRRYGGAPPAVTGVSRFAISATDTPAATTGFTTLTINAAYYHSLTLNNSATGVQNEDAAWEVDLAAGTWTIDVYHFTGTNRGIATLALADVAADGTVGAYTDVGTVDSYAGVSAVAKSSVTGVVVATSGRKRLRLKMATKNASSSAYNFYLSDIAGRRTA